MAVLKVETDIITSITTSPTGRAVILVIMYVKIFKTGVIVFNNDVFEVTLTDNFQYQSEFLRMRVIFVDQGQLSDPDFIGSTHQRENVQFADKYISLQFIKQKELY